MKETLRRLEFKRIIDMLIDQTVSAGGRLLAASLEPSSNIGAADSQQAETEEALGLLHLQEPVFLHDIHDIRPYLSKVRVGGMIYPTDIYRVYQVLVAARKALGYLMLSKGPRTQWLQAGIVENIQLEKEIRLVVDETEGVKDSASPELQSLRNRQNTLRLRIKDYLRDFIKSTNNQKFLQDLLVTERGGRYVVPVKTEYRNEIRGIVHDESASGATVYIEPEPVVVSNNEIRRLEAEEAHEIERILRRLSARIAEFADDLERDLECLETLDFWLAKARLALKMEAFRPHLNSQGRIKLYRARHPLLSHRAIPIDIEIGDKFDILVITGPNTGGKTVALKTVGLLTVMAMTGLFIPASSESEIAVFSEVLVDIGDEQSIEQSLSTFSSHMKNINDILGRANEHSLVILDELGAGTDPMEGGALARAILEKFLDLKSRVLVSTHHSELKTFAYQYERVQNGCVEFDPVSLRPTYRLTIGMPGQSNAFEIAGALGFDPTLVSRARAFVPQQEKEISLLLTDLKEQLFNSRSAVEAARVLQKQLLEERKALGQKSQAIDEEREQFLNKLKADSTRYLEARRREFDEIMAELKKKAREAEAPKWHEIEAMKKSYQQALPDMRLNPEPEGNPYHGKQVEAGDYVEIKSIRQKGYVLEVNQGEVVVQVGIMRLTVPDSDVIPSISPDEEYVRQKNRTYLDKRKNIPTEINLRGMLAEQALDETEGYIEQAFLAGIEKIRIIHGKGTGALRRAVRGYLLDHPYIKNFRDGEANEGGHGVTIAFLNK
ncbi:MAG: endonuclease MutS2 [Syntrophomonadaceae bacterium]|nr:endonuclease MutS2 [Syntrophomonadaceae bacterium]